MKLPEYYSFDYIEMKKFIEQVVGEVGLKELNTAGHPNAYTQGYKGLGLTYREESSDPHHDAFKLYNEKEKYVGSATSQQTMNNLLRQEPLHRFEKNFVKKTEYYRGPIEKTLNKFKSLITKVRLIELAPGESVHNHFDFPYYENIRVHASILTNKDVTWWVEENPFKIPADGNFYWFDTGRFHRIENKGNSPRLILSVHLSVFKDAQGNEIYDEKKSVKELINNCLF